MAHKQKIFISYSQTNLVEYNLINAWLNSEDYNIITSTLASSELLSNPRGILNYMTSINEKIRNASVFMILIGENTRELNNAMLIEVNQALAIKLPIIAVNINGLRYMDVNNCPSILRDKHVLHIAMNAKIIEKALEIWPDFSRSHQEDNLGPRYFKDQVYTDNGVE